MHKDVIKVYLNRNTVRSSKHELKQRFVDRVVPLEWAGTGFGGAAGPVPGGTKKGQAASLAIDDGSRA